MQRPGSLEWLESIIPDANNAKKSVFRIGDLARDFKVTLRTLRFYEDRGLIAPAREGSTRLYSQTERSRLKVILFARMVGFSLAEIQELMQLYDKDRAGIDSGAAIAGKLRSQLEVLKRNSLELKSTTSMLESAIAAFDRSR